MQILLVDNDPIFLKIITRFLSDGGHDVFTSPDGLSALDMAAECSPDFIFIDHVMPNIDGGTLCRILKSDPHFASSFIVILSAIAAEEWQRSGNHGADACIAKAPFDKMKNYLTDVIEAPEKAKAYCAAGKVIGIGDLYPRAITKELLSSKLHLNSLLDNMSEGIIELNTDRRIVYANPFSLEIFNKIETEILGLSIFDLFTKDQKADLESLLPNKPIGEHEPPAQQLLTFGSKHLSLKLICLKGDESHLLLIINDITEIRNNELNLIEANNFLNSIFDSSSSVSIISTDLDQNIVFWNKGAENLFGYSANDVVGKRQISILYPTDREIEQAKNIRETVLNKKMPVSFNIKERTKDGEEIWVKVHSSPRVDENEKICGILGIGEDITESLKLSEYLKRSEEKYRSVLEANPDPVIVCDNDGKVIYFNPAFTDIFGWRLEECLGRKMDDFVSDNNTSETAEIIEKVKSGEVYSGIETQRYTKDGATVDVSISASAYYGRDAEPIGTIFNIRDITEQKRIETQFIQAQKMESIGTLAGGIAHDFNNLLMGIQGRVSLMMIDTDPNHSHFDHLSGIEDFVKSAADLTKQLLGFARGGKYEVKPTNLNDILEQSANMFGRTRKEIRIEKQYEEQLWTAEVDRRQIEQIFLNLFVNAWQAMPDGGVLYLNTENVIINANLIQNYKVKSGKFVKVSISDTGCGMDEVTKTRIFEPFFSTKEKGRGTGLGLASVYGIIKNHNGFINVESKEGHGTSFDIFLPASDKPAEIENRVSFEAIQGKGDILVIDDEVHVLDVIKPMLEKLGYRVYSATNCIEAINIFTSLHGKIDLVVLDMIMPETGGGEVFDKLKEIDSGVKVLLSSGYSLDGQAAEIIDRGCSGFIQKPYTMKQLSVKIDEIIGS